MFFLGRIMARSSVVRDREVPYLLSNWLWGNEQEMTLIQARLCPLSNPPGLWVLMPRPSSAALYLPEHISTPHTTHLLPPEVNQVPRQSCKTLTSPPQPGPVTALAPNLEAQHPYSPPLQEPCVRTQAALEFILAHLFSPTCFREDPLSYPSLLE